MRDEAQVWLRVDPSANAGAKRLGARWDGGIDCWFAMTGVDLQAFEDIGVVPRARPEWRRLEGPERIDRSRARELGARRLTENLYIDVVDADEATLQAVRYELGARIMESIDQRWAWKAVNDINAEPPSDAFPNGRPRTGTPPRRREVAQVRRGFLAGSVASRHRLTRPGETQNSIGDIPSSARWPHLR